MSRPTAQFGETATLFRKAGLTDEHDPQIKFILWIDTATDRQLPIGTALPIYADIQAETATVNSI